MKCWCGGEMKGSSCLASEFHDPAATPVRRPVVRSLYVSGPMSGYEDCNYPAFHDATGRLREAGWLVVNPAEVGAEGGSYTDLIEKDIRHLMDCDGVATLEGWWASLGARTEVNLAGVLGRPVRSVGEWLQRVPDGLSEHERATAEGMALMQRGELPLGRDGGFHRP